MRINIYYTYVLLSAVQACLHRKVAKKETATEKKVSNLEIKLFDIAGKTWQLRKLADQLRLRCMQKNRFVSNPIVPAITTKNKTLYKPHHAIGYVHTDCRTFQTSGWMKSAVFPIWLNTGYRFINMYCDMPNAGYRKDKNVYITVQKRMDGRINFLRGWKSYVTGFGNPNEEYWAGLENIYLMTKQNNRAVDQRYSTIPPTLRIDMEGWDGFRAFAVYDRFTLYGGKYNYRVAKNLGKRTGNAVELVYSDPFREETFSTFDHIQDGRTFHWGCPQSTNGGWWFSTCSYANLNGRYPGPLEKMSIHNIYWRYWRTINKNNTALRYVSMKLRY